MSKLKVQKNFRGETNMLKPSRATFDVKLFSQSSFILQGCKNTRVSTQSIVLVMVSHTLVYQGTYLPEATLIKFISK